jgi:NAD(P)-dependent dehydrogenase (short-subunit alcohol dehydrogenase family)
MANIVITGANKGLGFEASRRLIALGHTVCVTARDRDRGRRAAAEIGATFVVLDVTSDASVADGAAAVAAEFGHVDVLINNAGIAGDQSPPENLTSEQMRKVYETNVFGVVRVITAFLPMLASSDDPSIINVGSESGSFASVTNPADPRFEAKVIVYGSSKAALSMLTVQYAKALPHMRVNAVAPGYTRTDFNGNTGPQTVTEGTDALISLVERGREAGTGRFYNRTGPIGW